jgi:hypothetical protein
LRRSYFLKKILFPQGYFINDRQSINTETITSLSSNVYKFHIQNINYIFYANSLKYIRHEEADNAQIHILSEDSSELKTWTAKCYFLGNIVAKARLDQFINKEGEGSSCYTNIDLVEIKTGLFSKIQVSYNAIICLALLNIPLNSKKDWKIAMSLKEQVFGKFNKLLKEEEVNENNFLKKEKEILKKEKENQREKREKERKKIEEGKKESKKNVDAMIERNKKQKQGKENAKLINLINNYGKDLGTKIYKKKIEIGMSKKMTIEIYGKPKKINEQVTKKITKHSFFYDSYQTKFDNTKFSFRVDLEENLVVGWKDLD